MLNEVKHKVKKAWLIAHEQTAEEVVAEIRAIRKHSNVLAITGKAYGNDWRGVYNGAVEMFPGFLLGLPHYYSDNIYSRKDLAFIWDAVVDSGFEKIVFTGYGNLMRDFFNKFENQSDKNSQPNIYLVYHGSLSQHAESALHAHYLKEIIKLQKRGVLHKIGFMKKGLAETFNSISGINGEFLITIVKDDPAIKPASFPGLNLGVFSHDSFRKNLHNQVAAALLFPNATVHVHDDKGFDYLNSSARFKEHPFNDSYDKFLQVLGGMTMNFYVTFSECYGMVIAESLSLGVPCLASCSSGFFDYDDDMKKWLVVNDYDNSEAIFKQGQLVLENRDEIAARGKEYIKKLNRIAKEKLTVFLND